MIEVDEGVRRPQPGPELVPRDDLAGCGDQDEQTGKEPGLAAYALRDPKRTAIYSFEKKPVSFDSACEARLRAARAAWSFFQAQPPGYRRLITHWVMSAKQPATRERRVDRLIEASNRGERL